MDEGSDGGVPEGYGEGEKGDVEVKEALSR